SFEINRLAKGFCNALPRGVKDDWYPTEDVMVAYLKDSERFPYDGKQISYLGERYQGLAGIEKDVVEFLQSNGPSTSPEIKSHLEGLGYKEGTRGNVVFNSALVYCEDREIKKRNRSYSCIATESYEGRYKKFARLLQKLPSLGKQTETESRQDQLYLRDYLFDGKDYECCALCGRQFPVSPPSALITAHKIKRSECLEQGLEEYLRDPYIVMPLCVFGCDFLYEHRYVRVSGGKVAGGKPLPDADSMQEYMASILCRPLDNRWLQGPEEYFGYGW
ncbi:MAG: hypothetical protein OXK21_06205, partial [Chloroflexota bacterium]|nr:hypothetical protein [Chloroflexota bacterium]